MNDYQIELYDQNGNHQSDHIEAQNTQEAADRIRADWKDCALADTEHCKEMFYHGGKK